MDKIIRFFKYIIWPFYELPIITYRKLMSLINLFGKLADILLSLTQSLNNLAQMLKTQTANALEDIEKAQEFEKKYGIIELKKQMQTIDNTAIVNNWSLCKVQEKKNLIIANYAHFEIKEVREYLLKQPWFVNQET